MPFSEFNESTFSKQIVADIFNLKTYIQLKLQSIQNNCFKTPQNTIETKKQENQNSKTTRPLKTKKRRTKNTIKKVPLVIFGTYSLCRLQAARRRSHTLGCAWRSWHRISLEIVCCLMSFQWSLRLVQQSGTNKEKLPRFTNSKKPHWNSSWWKLHQHRPQTAFLTFSQAWLFWFQIMSRPKIWGRQASKSVSWKAWRHRIQ